MVARFLILLILTLTALFDAKVDANTSTVDSEHKMDKIFSDSMQLGTHITKKIFEITAQGYTNKQAINYYLSDENAEIPEDIKNLLATDKSLIEGFILELIESKSLINAIKISVEAFPEKVEQSVSLANTLYPNRTQEVFDGISITGILPANEIKHILENAGIQTSNISNMSSNIIPIIGIDIKPLGAGIGSGGAGSGDITITRN